LGPNHTDTNLLTFLLRVLRARFLGKLFSFEGVRQRRELAADVREQEPLLGCFWHLEFHTTSLAGVLRLARVVVQVSIDGDLKPSTDRGLRAKLLVVYPVIGRFRAARVRFFLRSRASKPSSKAWIPKAKRRSGVASNSLSAKAKIVGY
jgi:hypothetical protein